MLNPLPLIAVVVFWPLLVGFPCSIVYRFDDVEVPPPDAADCCIRITNYGLRHLKIEGRKGKEGRGEKGQTCAWDSQNTTLRVKIHIDVTAITFLTGTLSMNDDRSFSTSKSNRCRYSVSAMPVSISSSNPFISFTAAPQLLSCLLSIQNELYHQFSPRALTAGAVACYSLDPAPYYIYSYICPCPAPQPLLALGPLPSETRASFPLRPLLLLPH